MNYDELKKIIDSDSEISKKIYICNFLTYKTEVMKNTKIYKVSMWLLFGQIMNMVGFKSKRHLMIKIQLPIMHGNY